MTGEQPEPPRARLGRGSIGKSKALQQVQRSERTMAVLRYIEEHPNVDATTLRKALGLSYHQLFEHLTRLRNADLITTDRTKQPHRYTSRGAVDPEEPLPAPPGTPTAPPRPVGTSAPGTFDVREPPLAPPAQVVQGACGSECISATVQLAPEVARALRDLPLVAGHTLDARADMALRSWLVWTGRMRP